MTRNEVEERAKQLMYELPDPNGIFDETEMRQIARVIREAVVQAYEEAAMLAEEHIAAEAPDAGLPDEIAAAIRALKDSLTVEETAQERRTENGLRRNAK